MKVSDVQNEYILHEAVIKNDVEAVREIMKEPVDVNMRNNVSNFSLIIICVRLKHQKLIKYEKLINYVEIHIMVLILSCNN